MIDIEKAVIGEVSKALRKVFGKDIYITGEKITGVPSRFPAVCVREASNIIYTKSRDENIENHDTLMYEVDVFSNLEEGKKQQAKEIAEIIDGVFCALGFTRTFCEPVENLSDSAIYRIKLRFSGVVDKQYRIYRN